ncbi:right-handed parallel beta-helix repeat-containing protein [Paenibacillus sp. MBLB4367]|uniref:right-handed parallel beta-helix repeat-containing protein n=1 Tax=Paenibacillus sp. MBLB4367 TaxID=3384767 RepID=UPI0039080472
MSKLLGKRIGMVTLFALIMGIVANIGVGNVQKVNANGNTYYVSPNGNDTNAGTESAPWKTLKKAAATLQAGDTAIFNDGEYISNTAITFANNGTAGEPITIKAKNKHMAKLSFTGMNALSKITLTNKQYITIRDFEISQPSKGTSSADIFININDCGNCTIGGNFIHNASGKAIQGLKGDNIKIINNTISDTTATAVVLANMDRPVIANNEISETNNAILVAGGTRSAQIYNNYIHAVAAPMTHGIVLGGNYPSSVVYDPTATGFEAYHAAAWNNIVVAESPGLIDYALVFSGSTNSGFYHNVVVGAKNGVRYLNGGSGAWVPKTTTAKLFNNIFSGCTMKAESVTNAPIGNSVSDYNLYHDCANAPVEPNGINGDPKFTDRLHNWHLQADSPALDRGTALNVTGFYGETIDVSLDYSGKVRSTPIPMGIYADTKPEVLFVDDFEQGANAWNTVMGNLTVVAEGSGNHALTQTDASSVSGVARSWAGSMDWVSYQFDAKIRFDQFYRNTSWLTLYARYVDANNYYLVEIQGDPVQGGYIGLKKKVNGLVIPLQEKTGWFPSIGQWIDMQLLVDGTEITFYVDGEKVLSGTDYELTHGAIAAAIYQTNVYIDDVKVTKRTKPAGGGPNNPGQGNEPGSTYYVSPTGSDLNPGSESKPWKTMAKAAETVQRGDTVIFEDGVYQETRVVQFARGGTENERIVFKARNKHQAIIQFYNLPTTKLMIRGTPYITLQDFDITQNIRGINTGDILVSVREGADHVQIIGNKFSKAFEEGVKGYLIHDLLVEGNIISDMTHEAVDFVNVHSSIVRNNDISEIGRVGLLAKGGSSDIQIYNNTIRNRMANMFLGAIYLGGQTDSVSTFDSSVNGYEAWNLVAYNNTIIAEDVNGASTIDKGIIFMGTKDSAAYNNIISGVNYGVYLEVPDNMIPNVNWAWRPDNVNPVFMNNIIVNSSKEAVKLAGAKMPINLTRDYNLYDGNAGLNGSGELHGVYANPRIANLNDGDWHLKEGSPAIGAGKAIPGFVLKTGETIDISADYDGLSRGTVWDQGIYRQGTYVSDNQPRTNETSLTSASSSIPSGETFKVRYGLNSVAERVYAQEVILTYDPGSVEFISAVSVKPGVSLLTTSVNPNGTVQLILASAGPGNEITGRGDIVELTFRAKHVSQTTASEIKIIDAALADDQGIEYAAALSSVNIQVIAGLPGDINQDNKVTVGDLAIIAANYGKNTSSPDWEQVKRADLNGDGKIDIEDLTIIAMKIKR